MSIKMKLLLAVFTCMLALAALASLLVRRSAEDSIQAAAQQAVESAAAGLGAMEASDVAKLSATLDALTGNPALQEAYLARDRDRLLALAAPIFERLKAEHSITHFYFLDAEPARTCFLRVHKPSQFGDAVKRATLSQAIETRRMGAGKELGKTAFALRVVKPWLKDGQLIGYLELGEEIDHFLAALKQRTGDDYGLLVEKRHLDEKAWAEARGQRRNNWGDRADAVLVDATSADQAFAETGGALGELPAGGRLLSQLDRAGKTLVRGLVPVKDAAGKQVGALLVERDISAVHDRLTAASTQLTVLVLVMAGVLGALLLWLAQRLVFARLDGMMASVEDLSTRLAGGDYEVGDRIAARSDDEIGRFEAFIGNFLSVVGGMLKELSGQAGKP